MTVMGITRTPRKLEHFDQICAYADVLKMVKELDYLVILASYTPENEGIVNANIFAAMKESAFFYQSFPRKGH